MWSDEELERTRRSLAMTSSENSAGGVRAADVIQLIQAVQQGRRLHRTLVELLNRTVIPAANAHLRHVMAAVASAVADATDLGDPKRPRRED